LYGRAEHGGQIPPQLNLKRLAGLVWSEHNRVHEAAQCLGGLRPAVSVLKRSGELCDLRAVDTGHLRMQERRRFLGGSELGFQLFPPRSIRVQLLFHD
jgi:hypothetical protein